MMGEATRLSEYLDFARRMAHEAGAVAMRYFRQTLEVERKADATPVTVADRECERLMRRIVAERYPEHGVLGEEYGEDRPGADWRWVIDPIDGTRAFVQGAPTFAILIGLEREADVVVGVVYQPATGEMVSAATGLGCWLNGAACRVNDCADLGRAVAQVPDIPLLMKERPAFATALLTEARSCLSWADLYGCLEIPAGRAEVFADADALLWDRAAVKPVVLEAGGRFTDFEGDAELHRGTTLVTNGALHGAMLELLAENAAPSKKE